MANNEIWKTRFTARQFDTSYLPKTEDILHICEPLNYMPYQVINDQTEPDLFWILLKPEDFDLKVWLVENFFYSLEKDGIKSHFTALIDAPFVLICLDIERRDHKTQRILNAERDILVRNSGVATGIIISQAIEIGIDVGQFACIQHSKEKIKELSKIVKKRFKKEWEYITSRKSICSIKGLSIGIGLGRGIESYDEDYHTHSTGMTFYKGKTFNRNQPFLIMTESIGSKNE